MYRNDRLEFSDRARKVLCAIACAAAFLTAITATHSAHAGCQCGKTWPHLFCRQHHQNYIPAPGDISDAENGGMWSWMRSPEQERRIVMSLFTRYCIRCHGVDGRGVWDIPDVPDFTNTTWQATRSDPYRTRVILQGRGAVMPAFQGTLTLEEAFAMARYLHTFVPGSQPSRPDLSEGHTGNPPTGSPATSETAQLRPVVAIPPVPAGTPGPFSR
jgi:mono/diheme cytochrome c family protein